MCYYNGQKVTRSEYIRLKNLEKLVANFDFLTHDLDIGFNYQPIAVLKPVANKEDFNIVKMEWGFIPDANKWPFIETREQLKQYRTGFVDQRGRFTQLTMLNAVCEELLLPNKIYRDAALNRRCLILSSGFYEWRHIYRLNKRTGQPLKTPDKYPYHIKVKDREYFFMAGVWQAWTDADTGEYVESCAIVTTKANELMEQVHNSKKRMPTILNEDLAYEWLFGKLDEKGILEIAATQFPANQMEAYTIEKGFINSMNPLEPFTYPDVPPIKLAS